MCLALNVAALAEGGRARGAAPTADEAGLAVGGAVIHTPRISTVHS
jgi:hypothetical protein